MTAADIQSPSGGLSFYCIIAVLALPAISFLVSLLVSERYSWLVTFSAPLLLFLSLVASVIACVSVWDTTYTWSTAWFTLSGHEFLVGLDVDRSAGMMMVVVTTVSFLVHAYSTGYMAGDPGIRRYFAVLGFFSLSMLGIVVADNLLLIFVFWELVGFSSYLLIGHWWERPAAAEASKRAFILNRIGDVGFVVALMLIWGHANTFQLAALSAGGDMWQTTAALCLFCAVVGKSAQFPLFTWLPDAMEGPTPVSALIHAATMVAAGVYLLFRVQFLFPPAALTVVALVGGLTSLIGALAALAQTDLKRILAYSTISQLGFMVMAAGIGASDAAMLHLLTHAFFKAGLFLGAGAVIHALHQAQSQHHTHFNVQDIRNLGGLRQQLPFTFVVFIICGGALAGLPFFSGFLSKDAILTALVQWKGDALSWRWLLVITAFAVSLLTVLYTFRMIWAVFAGEGKQTRDLEVVEPPLAMLIPMGVLCAGSIWLLFSANPLSFSGWIYEGLRGQPGVHSTTITVISALWVMVALAFAYRTRHNVITSTTLYHAFYIDKIYDGIVVPSIMQVSNLLEWIDKKLIDGVIHAMAYGQLIIAYLSGWFDRVVVDGLVHTVVSTTRVTGSFVRSFQGGKVQLYVFWSLFGMIIFIFWMLL